MMNNLKKHAQRILLLLLCAGCIKILYELSIIMFYEYSQPYSGDSHFFYTIGHGILQGFLPYTDLFETKPPGIFLLSAASLFFTGGRALGDLSEMIAILSPPLLFIGMYWQRTKKPNTVHQWAISIAAVLYFCILATFVGYTSGAYHTETFGVFFASLYCYCLLFLEPKKLSSLLCSTLCILCAIFFKEPFICILFACAILVSKQKEDFLYTYILPVLLAMFFGYVTLRMLGYWHGYLHVYLEEILSSRAGVFQPTWLSTIEIWMPFFGHQSIWRFSSLLSILVVSFLLFLPSIVQKKEWQKEAILIHGISIAIISLLSIIAIAMIVGLFGKASQNIVFVRVVILFALCSYGIYRLIQGWIREGERLSFSCRFLQIIAAILAMSLAVGSGGDYSPHQFSIAMPFLSLVGFLIFHSFFHQSAVGSEQSNVEKIIHSGALFLLCIIPFQLSTQPLLDRLPIEKQEEREARKAAELVDAILDACDQERYLIVGDAPKEKIWQFTKHVPLGPGFFQHQLNYPVSWRKPSIYFLQTFADNLGKKANIIVRLPPSAPQREIPPQLWRFVEKHFQSTPWKCAEKLEKPTTFDLLYRIHPLLPSS